MSESAEFLCFVLCVPLAEALYQEAARSHLSIPKSQSYSLIHSPVLDDVVNVDNRII